MLFCKASRIQKKIIAFTCNMGYYRSHEYEIICDIVHNNPLIVISDRLCLTHNTGETFPAHGELTVLGN
jgi:hypothetical protein